jgi:hypothetical protein
MSYALVVSAFEEVSVVEQATGEELSSVGYGPDVEVVEQTPVYLNPSLSFINRYHWYYGLLH